MHANASFYAAILIRMYEKFSWCCSDLKDVQSKDMDGMDGYSYEK